MAEDVRKVWVMFVVYRVEVFLAGLGYRAEKGQGGSVGPIAFNKQCKSDQINMQSSLHDVYSKN